VEEPGLKEEVIAIAVLVLLSLMMPAAAVAAEPAEVKVLQDRWFSYYVLDAKCGYVHLVVSEESRDGMKIISTKTVTHATVKRGNVSITMDQSSEFRETASGRPLSFRRRVTTQGLDLINRGVIKDGRLRLFTSSAGRTSETTYPWDPDTLFPYATEQLQKKKGLAPGTTYTVKQYMPSINASAALPVVCTVHGKQAVDVNGERKELNKLVMVVTLGGQALELTNWLDDSFEVWLVEMPFVQARMVRTDKQNAMLTAEVAEAFLQSLIPSNRKIEDLSKVVSAKLKLTLTNRELEDLPESKRQSVRRLDRSAVIVTTRRLDTPSKGTYALPYRGGDMGEYLRDNPMLQTKAPVIKAITKQAVGAETDPVKAARKIEHWVRHNIKKKNLSVALGTAVDVARSLEGDCTEHAVLAAALARASGIPSRIVIGIAYLPDRNVFGYHMWAECYVGEWMAVDPAYNDEGADPLHVAFHKSSLDTLNPDAELGLAFIHFITSLNVEILEVETE